MENVEQITVYESQVLTKKLEEMAQNLGIGRSTLARNLIEIRL
jgi:hypothetical protein